MEQVFLKIDTDNSGNLSLEEVVLFLKSITDDISEDNIEKIFEGIDTSGDKVVDLEEFKVNFLVYTNCRFRHIVSTRPTIGKKMYQFLQFSNIIF